MGLAAWEATTNLSVRVYLQYATAYELNHWDRGMVGGSGWTQCGASTNKTCCMEKPQAALQQDVKWLYTLLKETEGPDGFLCARRGKL